jgi:hypothetical protein
MRITIINLLLALALAPQPAAAQPSSNASSDEYTRYELLDPASAKFRIIYDVTATTPGATAFYNPVRKGSEASDESAIDLMTGAPLEFEVVTGAQAREAGFSRADLDGSYIKVALARPVPANGGEARIRILKTYRDPKSYFTEGDGTIVFARPLGIRRNAIVMPPGYEVIGSTVPVQVIEEPDGRIGVSFVHTFPGEAEVRVRARRVHGPQSKVQGPGSAVRGSGASVQGTAVEPALDATRVVSERARQDREIVYYLLEPETHSFRLYHDYTESREGVDRYVNIVRRGSTVSNPSAKILDTGEPLKTETLRGAALAKAVGHIEEPIESDTVGVIVRFPAVRKGRSSRLRIEETYTDAGRYGLVGDQLVWNRSFGRPYNAVLLPSGWRLTTSSVPATITEEDGKIRLDFVNPRNDEIAVYIRARRRP